MVYTLLARENPNTEERNPLRNFVGKEQCPSIIENKSSRIMISIRKERSPHPKHQENASTVEKEVILGKNVDVRLEPLSIL